MMMLVLAVLSASAAAGIRIALPLLVTSLLYGESLWSNLPFLNLIKPPILLSVLISWSLFELFASKKLLGQRILQIVQLLCSPVVGALIAVATAKIFNLDFSPIWLLGFLGAIFALLLTLVKVGWFFRLRGIPIWMVIVEDVLSIALVLFAFEAPQEGGLIALFLLWIAIRSATAWRDWYKESQKSKTANELLK